jgi:peptidoglycan hydrolase CwlO-like protein
MKKYIISLFVLISIILFNSFSFAEELTCSDYKGKVLTQDQYDKVLEICNAEIEREKRLLQKKVGETKGVNNEIINLDRKIKISQNYINQKILKLKRLKRSIGENKADINNLDLDIKKLKNSLKKLIYKKYQYQNYSTVETLFSKKTLSEFFQTMEMIEFLEKKIAVEVKEFKEKKKELEFLVGELEERDALEKQLIEEKKEEAKKIEKNKRYKKELLSILKKEVGVRKSNIADREKIRQEILRRKFTVASGAKVTFGEAYNIIAPYEKTLGMDPAFVLAILFQESGHRGKIGGNIGQCTYNQKNKYGNAKGGYTVMRNSQKSNFVKIMKGLGKNPSSQRVSCPIPRDGGYGGAMGPAQFMPNT